MAVRDNGISSYPQCSVQHQIRTQQLSVFALYKPGYNIVTAECFFGPAVSNRAVSVPHFPVMVFCRAFGTSFVLHFPVHIFSAPVDRSAPVGRLDKHPMAIQGLL